MLYKAMLYKAMLYKAILYKAMLYKAMLYKAIYVIQSDVKWRKIQFGIHKVYEKLIKLD